MLVRDGGPAICTGNSGWGQPNQGPGSSIRGTAGLNSLDLDSVGPNLLFVRLNMLGSQAETFCSFSLSVGKQ